MSADFSSNAYKVENCHRGKRNKERLTIFLGTNMNASEKLTILFIGKSRKPTCFQIVKSLPWDYESNKNMWITGVIYEAYLKRLNDKMKKAKWKIVIFVENCAAHSKDSNNLVT